MPEQDMLTEVNAEQWAAIQPDLEKLLKIKRKDGETLLAYATRLAKAANDPKRVTDDAWNDLQEVTQQWINGANVLDEKGEPVPLPPGAAEAEAAAQEGSGKASDGDEPTTGREGPGKGKAPGPNAGKAAKPKKPAKPARPAKEAKPAKPAKEAKPAKPVKKDDAKSRGRPTLFSNEDVITIKNKEPFRAGTASAIGFSKIKNGMTVNKAIEAGTPRRLIRWANICEYITVSAPAKKAA